MALASIQGVHQLPHRLVYQTIYLSNMAGGDLTLQTMGTLKTLRITACLTPGVLEFNKYPFVCVHERVVSNGPYSHVIHCYLCLSQVQLT